jgi:hypothetical protein
MSRRTIAFILTICFLFLIGCDNGAENKRETPVNESKDGLSSEEPIPENDTDLSEIPFTFLGDAKRLDFGKSKAEVAALLDRYDTEEAALVGVPLYDTFYSGWRVLRERFVFSSTDMLIRIETEFESAGEKNRDAFRANIIRSWGSPTYERSKRWDAERVEWVLPDDAGEADALTYCESIWETAENALVCRQFGSVLTIDQSVPVAAVHILAGDAPTLIDADTELHLEGFFLGMKEDDFRETLAPDHLLSVQTTEVWDGLTETVCKFNGGEALFVDSENSGNKLYSLKVNSQNYRTYRGLAPSDTAVRLIELYGLPLWIEDTVWCYGDGGYEYYRFTLDGGFVREINLHYSM